MASAGQLGVRAGRQGRLSDPLIGLPNSPKHYKQQDPLAPRALPRLTAASDPFDSLSPSTAYPVYPVIRPTLLRRFRDGTRRVSPVAQRVLVTMPSITTPPECSSASVRSRWSMLPSPLPLTARPPGLEVSRPPLVRLRYRLITRRHPWESVVGRFQNHGFATESATQATGLRL